MDYQIDSANSVNTSSPVAFGESGPSTLLVMVDGYLIARGSGGAAAELGGAWTATIKGAVEDFGTGGLGIYINSSNPADTSTITIDGSGDVYGVAAGVAFAEVGTLVNKGFVSSDAIGVEGNLHGVLSIRNSGTIDGDEDGIAIDLGGTLKLVNSGKIDGSLLAIVASDGNDKVTDYQNINNKLVNGTIVGDVNLGHGTNTFAGGANAETVQDGGGTDTVTLGGGKDTYKVEPTSVGNGTINGGSGTDTYDGSLATHAVDINLGASPFVHGAFIFSAHHAFGTDVGSDTVTNFENVTGGSGNDVMFGSDGANALSGGVGTDFLQGNGGPDVLTGGTGNDTFAFVALSDSTVAASGRDVIMDFVHNQGDKIDLSAIDADANLAGDQSFTFFGPGKFAFGASDLRANYVGGDTVVSGDVDGDGNADFAITLHGHLYLTGSDFVL